MKKIILATGLSCSITPMVLSGVCFADNAQFNQGIEAESSFVRNINTETNRFGKVVNLAGNVNLNVRSNSNTKSSIIGTLKSSDIVKITGTSANRWYQVEINGKKGYCHPSYISVIDSNSLSSNITALNTKGRVNTEILNVREKPTTQSAIALKLSKNTIVNITGKTNDGWYRINQNGAERYVSATYISLDLNSSSNSNVVGKIATVNTSVLNLRSGDGLNYSTIRKLYKNENVKILSSNNNGWYKVQLSNGITGWCSSQYISNVREGDLSTQSNTTQNINNNQSVSSNEKAQAIINLAKKQIGKPYVWGAEGPSSFDCSGLTYYVFKQASGVSLPRTSKAQSNAGESVSKANLKPGDLVFFDSNYGSDVNHVGIYIGDNQIIHSPKPGDNVKITNINTTHYNNAFVKARRLG